MVEMAVFYRNSLELLYSKKAEIITVMGHFSHHILYCIFIFNYIYFT